MYNPQEDGVMGGLSMNLRTRLERWRGNFGGDRMLEERKIGSNWLRHDK